MSRLPIDLTPRELHALVEPSLEGWLQSATEDDPISRQSNTVAKRHKPAEYIPAVKFLVDTSLQILSEPAVEEVLPREVYERQGVASILTEQIAELGVRESVFINFYHDNPELQLNADNVVDLNSPKYLGILGGAPFYDARVVAGGALRLLLMGKERGMLKEDPAEVIKRSLGLLAVSGVHKDNADWAAQYLGSPYARNDNFWGNRESGELKLEFTKSTLDILRRLHKKGGGCPAGAIAVAGAKGQSLLHEYWAKIVDYLIPEDATIDATL